MRSQCILMIWVILAGFSVLSAQSFHSLAGIHCLKDPHRSEAWVQEPSDPWPFHSGSMQPLGFQKQLDSVILFNPSQQEPENLVTYFYAAERLTEARYFQWNALTQAWVSQSRTLYDFDANNRLQEEVLQQSDGALWLNFSQIKVDYRPDGQRLRIHYADWDKNRKEWTPTAKDTQIYDQKNRRIRKERFKWENFFKDWVKEEAEELEYNAKDELATKTYLLWDEIFKIYLNSRREEYGYNQNGLLDTQVFLNWDESFGDWLAEIKEIRQYNARLRPITLLRQRWTFNGWENEEKTETSYDNADNPVRRLAFNWDDRFSRWTTIRRVDNEYDNRYAFNTLLLPAGSIFFNDPNGDFHHLLIQSNQFTFVGNNAINDRQVRFLYSDLLPVSTVQNAQSLQILFPNPVSDRIFIHGADPSSPFEFSLFDLQGCERLRSEYYSPDGIMVGHLPPGNYFYTIHLARHSQSGKVLIR